MSELKEGSKVRLKSVVARPKYGWGMTKRGDVGTVTAVGAFDDITVNFPNHSYWAGSRKEMEVVTDEVAVAKATPKVTKQKRKSPDKVLAYGVLTKEGKVALTTTDREYARLHKAKLGGKREGVTIVVLTAGKEIR